MASATMTSPGSGATRPVEVAVKAAACICIAAVWSISAAIMAWSAGERPCAAAMICPRVFPPLPRISTSVMVEIICWKAGSRLNWACKNSAPIPR